VDSAQRLELADLNLAEANRELARRAGGAVHDEDGLLLWAGAHPLPVVVNGAARTDGRMEAAEVLRRGDAFFAPRGRGFTVQVRRHADADLREAARAAGLVLLGEPPAMVLDRRLPDARPPAGVTLRRVESEDDALAFARLMDAAYASLGMPDGVARCVLPRAALVAPHIVTFLASLEDGRPAAGAMCIATHGVAGVYWVGTAPEARGRGLAELCTRAAGNAGFDLGARFASLQASVMGEPVYRRMGYTELSRYENWVRFAERRDPS
jgi:ribosomal protein S18 acetylase RimI-like enzyme